MNFRCTASLGLLLALASGQAAANGDRPLQLGYAPPSHGAARTSSFATRLPPAPRNALARPAHATHRATRNDAAFAPATPRLRERAMQSVFEAPEPVLEERRGEGRMDLRFERRGNAFRDLRSGYREMCDKLSNKIWDEPNGKRVRFDIGGRPGVGVEIPLGRANKR